MTTPTIPFVWKEDIGDTLQILDTLSDKIIYQVNARNGTPLYFYSDLKDDVCFDKKCRPIDLKIYWNITGRYGGFMLENEEFLSRREHEAFDSTDYQRLHALLADPMLPFTNVSFEQLVDHGTQNDHPVDAISGATARQLSNFVVEGAAYTTYLLWTALYGSANQTVQHATERQLNNDLLLKILKSVSSTDQIWALNRINTNGQMDPMIEQRLIQLIRGDEFFVSYSAISLIRPTHLQSKSLQLSLFSIYKESMSNNRKPILERLYLAPELDRDLVQKSHELLPKLNGNELGQWL
ncbi:MAG: hypothetical protein KDC53_00330, partial [Saprospiraceae bacterium]|nr:hypothetical protein [Saprospiraceae bacterium]